jgi:hypothetical protein
MYSKNGLVTRSTATMSYLEEIWHDVNINPTNGALKLKLADVIGNCPTATGLRWAASHGKHPHRIGVRQVWAWYIEDDDTSAPHSLPEPFSMMIAGKPFDEMYHTTLSRAFGVLGEALTTLREIVQE